jgi:hypothetical protein
MNRPLALLSTLAFASLVGCQYDPWADKFLTHHVSEQDVVGFYLVDQASMQRTIKMPMTGMVVKISPAAHISLSPDHKAEFFQVPEAIGDDVSCSITGRGTWRFGKNNSYVILWTNIADEEPNEHCKSRFNASFAEELNLYGGKPPFKLHVTIGDPDSGDAIQFERRN